MLAVNYSTIRNNFKSYCDRATDYGEVVIVTRKQEKNVVIMSLDNYNKIMKEKRNELYLDMVEAGIAQMRSGTGQAHDLIEE